MRAAIGSLSSHKARTSLTILGIVVGVAAIMIVVSVGSGAEALVLSQVEGLGARTIAVAPGREPSGPTDPALIETFYGKSLKERELLALQNKNNAPHIEEVMPAVFQIETVSFEGETFQPMIIGATELIGELFNVFPNEGHFFTEDDVKSKAPVAIIGKKVKDELFGASDAIGEKIRVKDVNLRVVGTLPKKGQVLFFNFDEAVIVPYTVAQQNIFGFKHFSRLIVQARTEADVQQTVLDIETTLRELHGITDPEQDDFFTGTQEEIADTLGTVTGVMTAFLASVAAISLLVGGVGIMNIMLVSVAERTKEIGLRKALGATRANVLMQFLLEAMAITLTGGIFGILFGGILSYIISIALSGILESEWVFTFPLSATILGVGVSVLVGLVFGLYPAYRAAKKSPLEAMRYE